MLLGFKTQLKISNKQRTLLAQHAGVARHAWNEGLRLCKSVLNYNQANPTDKIKFPSSIDLHKWLVASIKPQFPWYYDSSKCCPQYALRALRDAWNRCFKKVSGVPRFKKKGIHDSFTLDGTIKVVAHRTIQVPVMGILKTYEKLPFGLRPKSVTISRQADRWFISYKLEAETTPSKASEIVGVDLGILRFATLSTGEQLKFPMPLKKLGKKLSKLQWRNRHKELHSNNWQKAQRQIARLHTHIANVRKDFIHKLTTKLVSENQAIVIEDLQVKGMMANHKLAKAIADCGFFEFRRQLTYKAELYGSRVVLADQWFPSSKLCSNCGHKKSSLSLSERTYHCGHCHLEIDRDLNASRNLVALI